MLRKLKTERARILLLNLSPWILATACTLLLVLLTLFAFQNYQREKFLVVEGLGQRALTLLRFIDSSIRTTIRQDMRNSNESILWTEHMQSAMGQAVEQPGVEFVLLVASSGDVLVGAGDSVPAEALDTDTFDLVRRSLTNQERRFVSRIVQLPHDGKRKIQIASKYLFQGSKKHFSESFRRSRMVRQFSHHPDFRELERQMTLLRDSNPVYIIQLDFDQFSSPLKNQALQIIILFVVLILVVAGGALSFLTLRGLKGSQLRLGKIRAFTDILVSSLPIGLIATNDEGAIQVCNKAAGDILEIDTEKIQDTFPHEVLPHQLLKTFSGMSSGENSTKADDVSLRCESGKVKSLQLASVVVFNEVDEFGGEVLLIRDSTEIKALEKELKRNERLASLGKMAAGVAHELRNPLSSIKGLAVLLKTNFSAESKEAATAELLVGEVERLNRSISELLDYAKPANLYKEKLHIEEIIKKTASLVRGDADSFNIRIELDVDRMLPQVHVDRDKINQVFLNLFLNAVQAMPDGGTLRISAAWEEPWVVVTVWDNGMGIEEENLQKIFDPYFTTKNNGTGLGLSLSSKFIEEHGGQLKVTSNPSVSTQVHILLPQA